MIFDEPTAVLTPQEVVEFFEIIKNLKKSGKAIIFITHKLQEVLEICDRINVLRRGEIVGEAFPKTTNKKHCLWDPRTNCDTVFWTPKRVATLFGWPNR